MNMLQSWKLILWSVLMSIDVEEEKDECWWSRRAGHTVHIHFLTLVCDDVVESQACLEQLVCHAIHRLISYRKRNIIHSLLPAQLVLVVLFYLAQIHFILAHHVEYGCALMIFNRFYIKWAIRVSSIANLWLVLYTMDIEIKHKASAGDVKHTILYIQLVHTAIESSFAETFLS